ncbi:MAG: hypothetical protein DSZ11_05255 [Sulfurovum sp.]|nr:MAG: hypothetical protein DSZ11_05255 [Sulfurovum sp.]
MKKIIVMGVMISFSILFANEPSVYGAGDIDVASPYGLSSTEKNVISNRKQIQQLRNQVSEHQSRIAGLTTVIDGLNKQVLDLKEQLQEKRKIDAEQNDNSKKQEEDAKKTYTLLLELGKMIDQINDSYVTKDDLTLLKTQQAQQMQQMQQVQQAQQMQQQESPIITRETDNSSNNGMIIDGRDGYGDSTQNMEGEQQQYGEGSVDVSNTYREAVQAFSHKSYNTATEKFKQAIAQNYKTAPSNYYLGEIAYYTNDYYSAISYYKKSASLYNKASYMKILYLHTALSLSKTGQHDQARGFFRYVVDNYPNTKSAEIAQKNL